MQGVSDGDLLISGLQHFSFCRRQWALIHIEMQWADNYLTVDGSLRHDRADDPEFTEKRGVEYKRGRPKEIDADRLQLCAEAICLEEMLCCPPIPTAYLYYMETKRRESVALSPELRNEVERMLTEMRALYDRGYTPKVKQTAKCRACSLADICLPRLQKCRSASTYTQDIWKDGEDNA